MMVVSGVAHDEYSLVGRITDVAIEGQGDTLVARLHVAVFAVDVVDAVALGTFQVQGLLAAPAKLVVVVAVGAHQVVAAQLSVERAPNDESLPVAHAGIADALAGDGRVHGQVQVGGGKGAPVGREQQVGGAIAADGFHHAEVAAGRADGAGEGTAGIERGVEGEAAIGVAVHVVGLAGRQHA